MSNFSFLQEQNAYSMFAASAIEAEKVYATSTTMCVIGCRKAMELAVKWVYAADTEMVMPYRDNLQALIHEPSFRFALDKQTWEPLLYITKLGNMAVHTEKLIRNDDAVFALKGLFDFIQWIDYCYGADYEERVFDEKAIPQERVVLDEIKIKEQESLLGEKDAKIKAIEAKLAKMASELTAAKESNKQQRNFNPEKITEFETRKRYIDLDLELMDWSISGKGQNVSEEFEVTDMNNILGQKGYVDYVLWGDNGCPLAIVEAKRTSLDANKGKQQAKLYADALERQFKRRPFIFYTNGFETYFWNDLEAPPRLVSSVFSKADMEKLMNRRQKTKDPNSIEIDKEITGRYYQMEAIRAVCDNVNKGFRKNLLVMATGTGKTRTAASLVDVLSKAGHITNVLFLADRTALVKQARDAFKEYLPHMSLCNLCHNKEDYSARVVFSTYPTILGAIDEKKSKDGSRMFSPAHFDLIIIDEAHRSIFNKYRVIFDYFDAMLVGLTATPKTEVDTNTYTFFEMEDNVPTFAYEYQTAVKDGYLVDYYNYEVKTSFISGGIRRDELTPEEQARYDAAFEDGDIPDYIAESKIDKNVFATHTIKMVLDDLMTRGIKTNGGDKLGKTIIFAENKKHAQLIVEQFDKMYPHYKGHFAKRVVCDDDYAQTIIDEFKIADKEPQIAVSVDMMDTGIDVPEVVNLVFFKKVRSKVKFWQMIGRGTRLCPNLNCVDSKDGEYVGKKYFLIFDYGQNFEYFKTTANKEFGSGEVLSLTEAIFNKQVRLIELMQGADYSSEECRNFRKQLVETCHNQIANLNSEVVAVRLKRKWVEKYSNIAEFDYLSGMSVNELKKEIAKLVVNPEKDEYAKRFDNLMYGLMLDIEEGNKFKRAKDRLQQTAQLLEQKSGIPHVGKKIAEIKIVNTPEYWKGIDLLTLEKTRQDLRDLIQFIIEPGKGPIIFEGIHDEVIDSNEGERLEEEDVFVNYRQKVNRYIEMNKNSLAIFKLTHNKPLTGEEYKKLEDILYNDLGSKDDYKREFGVTPLGILIRTIAGMDEEAIREAFADFINSNHLNQNQIVFMNKIVDYIKVNGYVETKQVLMNPPFTEPRPMTDIFEVPQLLDILSIVDTFRHNATYDGAVG